MAESRETEERLSWTLPDSISAFRIVGSFALFGLAWFQLTVWFVSLYLVLGFTDLIDGPIARWLGVQSSRGAWLDSIADWLLSAALLFGVVTLNRELIESEIGFIAIALASFIVSLAFCYLKFHKLPSYHTFSAKLNHLLVAVAGVVVILDWSAWPLRIAAITTTLVNFENLLISVFLAKPRSDIPSLFSLGRVNREDAADCGHSSSTWL